MCGQPLRLVSDGHKIQVSPILSLLQNWVLKMFYNFKRAKKKKSNLISSTSLQYLVTYFDIQFALLQV